MRGGLARVKNVLEISWELVVTVALALGDAVVVVVEQVRCCGRPNPRACLAPVVRLAVVVRVV